MTNRPTPRTERIRKNATAAAYDECDRMKWEEPREPNAAEVCYLDAVDLFNSGRQCAGWDKVEEGDKLSGLG